MCVGLEIACPAPQLQAFLLDVGNMSRWTAHRSLFLQDGQWYEVRSDGTGALCTLALNISSHQAADHNRICFAWSGATRVDFLLRALTTQTCHISADLSAIQNPQRLQQMQTLLQIELRILQQCMERGTPDKITPADWIYLQKYHLDMYKV